MSSILIFRHMILTFNVVHYYNVLNPNTCFNRDIVSWFNALSRFYSILCYQATMFLKQIFDLSVVIFSHFRKGGYCSPMFNNVCSV